MLGVEGDSDCLYHLKKLSKEVYNMASFSHTASRNT